MKRFWLPLFLLLLPAAAPPRLITDISHSKIDTSTARNMVLSRGLLGRAGAAIATSILLGGGRTVSLRFGILFPRYVRLLLFCSITSSGCIFRHLAVAAR